MVREKRGRDREPPCSVVGMRAGRALICALVAALLLSGGCGDSEVELDAADAGDLLERIDVAAKSVTSSQTEMYMSMQVDLPDGEELEFSDALMVTVTVAGDRSLSRFDPFAMLVAAGLPEESIDAEMRSLSAFEWITEGGRLVDSMRLEGGKRVYARLSPLVLGMPDQPGWVLDRANQHGGDVADLWGLVDLSTASYTALEALEALAPMLQPMPDEIADLPEELEDVAVASGEVRNLGKAKVGGVEVDRYSVVLDSAELAGVAALVDQVVDIGDPAALQYLEAFTVELYVDEDDRVRRSDVKLDMGVMVELMRESGEFTDAEIPKLSGHMSIRTDTALINDPALHVTLPDPSLVVNLP